jgi:glycerophosphoryl diester phosphodiesterase
MQALTEPAELRALAGRPFTLHQSPRRPTLVHQGEWLSIAHAGGALHGLTYTNAQEALEASYARGARVFELDFHWTADGRLVCIHDWEEAPRTLSGRTSGGRLTARQLEDDAHRRGLTVLDLTRLAAWMKARPDARIVTDAKESPLLVLRAIYISLPEPGTRVIPQVYRFAQFDSAAALGYSTILLTLYQRPYTSDAVVEFVTARSVAGVVMSAARAHSELPERLRRVGVASLVYGVNEPAVAARLRTRGIAGIITDSLLDQ